jgi:hypothetical protein
MTSKTLLLLLAALAADLHAAPRAWKSADGQRSVEGEFVRRDAAGVTILRSDRKEVVIPLNSLHPDDRTWLNVNHPVAGTEASAPNAVFDQLAFGDTRAQVLEKLKASKFVEMTSNEAFVARTGLNGIFRTRKKIGGLDASLFFDWTESGELKEITLQTAPLPASALDDQLTPCWKDFITLLTTLHGKPFNANNQLDIAPIADGAMSGTHLWKLDHTGTAMLGAAREGDNYQVAVRFTREDIQPVIIPGPTPVAGQIP